VKLPVAILAGGLAKRLHPITQTVPKAMVEVAGRPFIDWQLQGLAREGVRHVVLCVGHYGEAIAEFVGDGRAWGIQVEYSFDGDELRGTGGALLHALDKLGPAFLVLYGDSLLQCRFADVEQRFVRSGKDGVMTVLHNDGQWDASNVLFEDGELRLYDKKAPLAQMCHIDYGLVGFRSDAFRQWAPGPRFDLADYLHVLSRQQQLLGVEVHERFYEIGSHHGLAETTRFLSMTQTQAESPMNYSQQHLAEATEIIQRIDTDAIEKMAVLLAGLKKSSGRLFFLGVGGSAGNCSHAVNDFRKIVGIEAYAPTDNVSELTARTNDEGWPSVFVEWLKTSRLQAADMLFIFSVGGGSLEKNISPNLVLALQHARTVGARILGVVGRDGGYTAQVADACVIVPTVNADNVTPHSEAFQAVIWHLLVSHPVLKAHQTKWEAASGR
jgi:D-sedoheptulose 7-phosphate isomerase